MAYKIQHIYCMTLYRTIFLTSANMSKRKYRTNWMWIWWHFPFNIVRSFEVRNKGKELVFQDKGIFYIWNFQTREKEKCYIVIWTQRILLMRWIYGPGRQNSTVFQYKITRKSIDSYFIWTVCEVTF